MLYGTVVQFFDEKGFGFIKSDSGHDIFFHISALECEGTPPSIKTGQAVKYELAPREKPDPERPTEKKSRRGQPEKRRAKLVELIDRIPGGIVQEDSHVAERHPRARRKKPTWRR